MTSADQRATGFGANSWLVEEMYEQFRSDPESVSETWREFFDDYPSMLEGIAEPSTVPKPAEPAVAVTAPVEATPAATAPAPAPAPAAPAAPAAQGDDRGEPIRGAGVAIATNMERSLGVPTATSFRNVPAKLLEVNRSVINGYRARTGQGKVSFTHLIGYAIVRAIADAVPNMNNTFVTGTDGKPRIVRNEHVNMGLAVDVDKGDGQRTLVVPVLRDADTLDFAGFLAAYEDVIRKVRANKLAVSDFQGATVSLTNPGTIGTVQSVPRLMPGQGVIVGVGNIDYPAEFQGADERTLHSLGVSKVVTVTSTYDHRIIQGAESGLFLKRVHELLLGEHGFYDAVFRSLEVPYESVKWRVDQNPVNSEEAMLHKQM
ncbi:MAG TPA: 2-oxo acid dehydrogenase subunit E2, partial [Ilumatobacteraceae bacterium]|nr:2-oxo acid dehydrogenase subunit E2 [Ilumatobacteraceae bacterium]